MTPEEVRGLISVLRDCARRLGVGEVDVDRFRRLGSNFRSAAPIC